ncbi:MAG: YihY/virulence factor BrkB family protein, partial [Actinobacteria bacterium]|nr:YihY/virulence factor BrkB family protein [Actinomycetota bacterium]
MATERTASLDPPAPLPSARRGPAALVARATALAAWFARTRAGRANARFGAAGGGVLTGGIAYATLFSVFAALTLGFSVFMAVLGGNEALRSAVVAATAAALPGVVDTGDGDGLVDPTTLRLSTGFTLAGAIALVTLVLSAMSAVAALQTGLRAMLGIAPGGNAVLGKLRQLAATAGLALTVLLAAVLTLAVTAVAQALVGALGWSDGSEVVVRVLAPLISFGIDAGVFVLLVRVLTATRPARRDLWTGALVA